MRRIYFFLITAAVACLATIGLYTNFSNSQDKMISNSKKPVPKNTNSIRFIPIGDSYTIGLGVAEKDRWPNLLIESLGKEGIAVELVVNPSVSGYQVTDAMERELPIFEREKPDLATLYIGANDAFRQADINTFKQNYSLLVNRMQSALTKKENLILITIPNYAKFPAGVRYGAEGREELVIEQYNQVIREEATTRNLKLVDLFKINTINSEDYFISDGLHPNPKGIKVWHDAIFPVIKDLLKE